MKPAQRLLSRSSSSSSTLLSRPHLTPATHHAAAAAATTILHVPRRTLHLVQHHHLTPSSPIDPPFVRYDDAAALQDEHRARFLAWKAGAAASHEPQQQQADAPPPPRPQLLSFQAQPTYTLGRRQDALTPSQAARLAQPLRVSSLPRDGSGRSIQLYTPQVRQTSRGGLTTYHGPGQLVLWPVLDMHSPLHARFGVASYARLLEKTTRGVLADRFGVATYAIREEPGVWAGAAAGAAAGREERKIAALGVHHRRYVTALGVALNVNVPTRGVDEGRNPWARFVPCGLQGKKVTSVAAETGREDEDDGWDMEGLAEEWAARFEEGLIRGEGL
ncbi:hypothetical protein MY11210_003696 [Beauveria gryllotalpidicola]